MRVGYGDVYVNKLMVLTPDWLYFIMIILAFLGQLSINELVKGKTIIIIAHRLATIESADQILVVNKGKIVQKGRHKDLIQKEGVY